MKKLVNLSLLILLTALCACDVSFLSTRPGSTVNVIKINPQYILLEPSSVNLVSGQERIISSFVYMDDGSVDISNTKISWQSEDRSILEIDQTGKLRAIREGEAAIVAKHIDNGITARLIVQVLKKKLVEKIEILPGSLQIKLGAISSLIAIVSMTDNTKNANVFWSSSDNTIASVDQSGKVTAVKRGTASITATFNLDNSYRQSIDVEVIE